VRYPLPNPEVVRTLGYGAKTPVPVPGALLALVPVGRPLDPRAALSTAPITSRPPAGADAGAAQTAQPDVPAT